MNQVLTLSQKIIDDAFSDLNLIRQQNPVIHNITNYVAMQTSANVLLAIGASPLMAHAKEELAEISQIANALVINIGTLDNTWIDAITFAQHEALKKKIPIIFDPVGAGASSYRTDIAKKILATGVNVIRGNSSEILALHNADIKNKGIDAKHSSEAALDSGLELVHEHDCTVVISGATDIILDKTHQLLIPFGTPLFTKVTATGCAATSVIGAFAAIHNNPFLAAAHAMIIYTLAGEKAAIHARGPGSFSQAFIDTLYSIKIEDTIKGSINAH